MNIELYKIWLGNPLINPITNRKIKKDGATYKKIQLWYHKHLTQYDNIFGYEDEDEDKFIENKTVYQFFSRSKDLNEFDIKDWRKRLSNFFVYKNGIQIGQYKYLSVEHYYQSQKFILMNNEDLARLFRYNEFKYSNGCKAKKGATELLKKFNLKLPKVWHEKKYNIMKFAIENKIKNDQIIRDILNLTQTHILLHFERNKRSYWGGHVSNNIIIGENMLGKIYMELR